MHYKGVSFTASSDLMLYPKEIIRERSGVEPAPRAIKYQVCILRVKLINY